MLASLGALGGRLPATYVVGCEPADTTRASGCRRRSRAAVDRAVETVAGLLARAREGSV